MSVRGGRAPNGRPAKSAQRERESTMTRERRMNSRKWIRRLAGAVAISVLAVACAGETGGNDPVDTTDDQTEDQTEDQTDDGTADGGETVELTFWTMLEHDDDNPRAQAEKTMIERFEAEHPNIQVNVDTVQWNELPGKTILAVQGGGGPDVARVSFGQTLEYLELETLQPLDPFIEGEGNDFLGESTVFDGQRMAIVFAPVPNGILYRTDLFDATGLEEPATWEELADVAEAMTTEEIDGFAFGMQPGKNLLANFLQPYMWGAGENAFENECAAWDSQAGVDAIEWLVGLEERGVMSDQMLQLSNDDVLEGFRAGQYAMVIEESSRSKHAATSDVTEGNVGVWQFPSPDGTGSPPYVFSWSIGMMSSTEHPDEAWELIEFLTSNEADAINAEMAGELPSRASSLEQEWFQSEEASMTRQWVEYLADFTGTPQAYPDDPTRFRDELTEAVHSVFLEGTSVQEALTESVQDYNTAIGCGA